MKRLLITLAVLLAWFPARAQTLVVIGDTTTTGSTTGAFGNGTSYVRGPFPVPPVGTIVFDSILLHGWNSNTPTAGNEDSGQLAVYSENASAPGSRLWLDTALLTTTPSAFHKGFRTMSLSFSSGTYANIWLAFGGTTNDSASTLTYRNNLSTGCLTFTGTGVPPLTWPACTPTTAGSILISLWGHTTGGGGSPSPNSRNVLIRKASSAVPSDPWRAWRSPLPENWRWRG